MLRVEVCGGIASGKTTITGLLSRLNIRPIYENFSANPFYKAFYRNPSANAFETEITFLLQHFHDIRGSVDKHRTFCCDFSFVLDRAYADVTLKNRHRTIFMTVYREVQRIVGPPDLLIHLRCDPVEELRRIRRRHRALEQTITIDYLAALNEALARRVLQRSTHTKMIEIDSSRIDFAHKEDARTKVLALIGIDRRRAKS